MAAPLVMAAPLRRHWRTTAGFPGRCQLTPGCGGGQRAAPVTCQRVDELASLCGMDNGKRRPRIQERGVARSLKSDGDSGICRRPPSGLLQLLSDLARHRFCRTVRGRKRGLLRQVAHSSKFSLVLLRYEPEVEVGRALPSAHCLLASGASRSCCLTSPWPSGDCAMPVTAGGICSGSWSRSQGLSCSSSFGPSPRRRRCR